MAPLQSTNGWEITSGTNYTFGGTGTGEGNQFGDAVELFNGSGGRFQGNIVGLNAAGTALLSGSQAALGQYGNYLIGGGTTAAQNVFASGAQYGVVIKGFGADNVVIRGNYIGTNIAGTAALGSFVYGVWEQSTATGATIDGNVIATASAAGIYLDGNTTDGNPAPDYAVAWFAANGNLNNSAGYFNGGAAVGTVAYGTGMAGGQALQFIRSNPGYVATDHSSYALAGNTVSVEGWVDPATLHHGGADGWRLGLLPVGFRTGRRPLRRGSQFEAGWCQQAPGAGRREFPPG